ncbi:SurA N-terminal domain-containing protein [Marinobacter nauticus]|jgi:peptidyl-prolyl cis-trans isomerase D|uniref:Periplasmic chaperone PpiD n=3 Tax=Marinobacter nauticus TaxID=2743 RepID=A0A833JM10_MARNT|nr:SurA N-terminal domain-containing protein [Marinobacter nauticus]MEC8823718.1 SurA N-terminal domain-containing protein [Pseudomonadota bacterium]KAE8543826.1 Peptidyl-prolyl cis-trans isomerase PpiD [Marinobacter nauticus]MEC9039755.1 SurA N-terminal domain-containing protein [Pseudomonadota bacterium]MEC9082249.1 SurA N-terminal domain-containing protein [Pseudomonadota bacterium]HCP21186.1 peptidylprolyl isomerase [Marinobacter nauticus]
MLQDIRDNAQSTIAKVIVGLLIISLSIWGMDAIIGGFTGEPEVATVNGQDITEREFLRTVQMESQQRLMQMENPDQSLLDEDQIRRDVLDALIREAVLTQDAQSQGLELTDADIDSLITQMPQFQVDGQFNRDRFVATVRNLGMGVAEFRESMRKNYVVNQIRAAIVQTGVVAPENAAHLLAIQNQTRDFRVLTLDGSSVQDKVDVTEADVQAYYDENRDQFRQPEQVDAAYITLSQGALAESIEVSEDEVRAYYEERAEEYAREERRAAHILVEAGDEGQATLATIQQRLEDGESFAVLAEEYSVDTVSAQEGGDLGFAGRGVYDEAFEDALFGLEEGEVSGPVETSFGLHLIKLEEVRRSDVPAFDELREDLRLELARTKASERFAEVRSQLADAAYAADDLASPAEELGLEIRVVEGVSRDGGAAPFDHAGLVRQLFSEDVLEGGYNTELIDVGDNVSVVARVREYHEPRQLELADVEPEIRRILERTETRDALAARVDELVAQLESGTSADELGAGEWQQFEDQGRSVSGLSPRVVQEVFSMARPDGDSPTVGRAVTADQAAVIVLTGVNEGEVDQEGAEYQQLMRFLAQLEGQREYTAYQQYLRNTAEVERN